MSSGFVRSICSSVSLGEQLLRSSWAPGPCGSSTLANTRKPMASKCCAVACPKPESQPARTKRSPAVAGDSRQPAVPSPQGPPSSASPSPGTNPRDQTARPSIGPRLGTTRLITPLRLPTRRGRDLALGHSQVTELLFSLYHARGRKKTLPYLHPIAPSASLMRGTGKTAGTARHRDSPEPCSDVGWEPSTPKIASKTSIGHHSELAQGSVVDAAFPQMLFASQKWWPRGTARPCLAGVLRGLKRERKKEGSQSAPATLHPSREHPTGMSHAGEHWVLPCLVPASSLPSQLEQGHRR